ncbi:MAG: amidohydrolase family protein [Kibdelosporangium sp.]
MLIDAHAHLVTDDPGYPFDPPTAPVAPDGLMPAEHLLESLRANKASAAIAVQRAHVYGYDNSYVLDSAQKYPDRLRAMCVIDGQAEDADRTVRELAGRGAVAIRLTAPGGNRSSGPGGADWFAGAAASRVWAAAAATGLSMCLHVYRWNRGDVLRALPAVAQAFPDVPVVLDHVAALDVAGPRPYPDSDLLLALVDLPRVHIKVTTLNFAPLLAAGHDPQQLVGWLATHFGPSRLLWGSDITQTKGEYDEMVAIARRAVASLPGSDADEILGGTAARLYALGPVDRG